MKIVTNKISGHRLIHDVNCRFIFSHNLQLTALRDHIKIENLRLPFNMFN